MSKIFSLFLSKMKKLSLIEFLILLIVSVVLIFSLFWFSRTKKLVEIDLVAKPMSYTGTPPQYWVTNSINKGDSIYNEFGRLVGTVNHVENVDFGGAFRYLRVSVELETILNSRTQLHSYGNQRLRIGDDLTLTIKNVKFTGIIKRIENSGENQNYQRKTFRLKVFMRNVPIWNLKTYDDSFKVYDDEENLIFQIIKILSEKPSTEEVIKIQGGTIQYVESELHRNVEMEILAVANCEQGVCYFNDDQPIKIGSQIWAQTDKTFVSYAIITEILEEKDLLN